MRILALDVGDRRIGVAISDVNQVLARSLQVIERRSRQEDFAAVARLVEEYEVEKVVVGYPRSLDGSVGSQARKVERYAGRLAKALTVPVLLWDERLSTVTAERLMREGRSRSKKKQRQEMNAVAAAVILQDYLDSKLQDAGAKHVNAQ